jgi:glycerol-3-phosphate dehydrogenase
MLELCPPLRAHGLAGGYRYLDAQVDDARLVLRVLREARQGGALALNYARVLDLLRGRDGQVCGAVVRDEAGAGGRTLEVRAPVVISATGVWADDLRRDVLAARQALPGFLRQRLRRLRGSHLVFSGERLPLARALSFLHPADRRPVFVVPWEGVTLIGTTDVDHDADLEQEPVISSAEAAYLLDAADFAFPSLGLGQDDVRATFSGVRPVVNTGRANPSAESREHVLWDEGGLITVTGGKLTTFRLMARAALRVASRHLETTGRAQRRPIAGWQDRALIEAAPDLPQACGLNSAAAWRLAGRYGLDAWKLVEQAGPGELEPMEPGCPALWAEARWAAEQEAVVHLDDLLLRRVRLGLLCPQGGLAHMDRLWTMVGPALGWTPQHWRQEVDAYARLWARAYAALAATPLPV